MEISFPFVACVRTAGRKKICQIVAVQFLQGGLGPFRGLDAARAPKTNDNPDLWPSQQPPGHSGHSTHGTGSATLAAYILPEQNHASDEQFISRFKHQRECSVIGQRDWQRYAGFLSLNDVLVG